MIEQITLMNFDRRDFNATFQVDYTETKENGGVIFDDIKVVDVEYLWRDHEGHALPVDLTECSQTAKDYIMSYVDMDELTEAIADQYRNRDTSF